AEMTRAQLAQLPEQAARTRAETEQTQAQTALARAQEQKFLRETMPAAVQLLQNHQQTIAQLRDQVASGQMSIADANDYATKSREYMQAGLAGATPFQQQQEAARRQEAQQKLGADLLGDRMRTQSSLAAALTNGAMSLAGNTMMPAGKSSIGYDPTSLGFALA